MRILHVFMRQVPPNNRDEAGPGRGVRIVTEAEFRRRLDRARRQMSFCHSSGS
jgi:hypothetical protein